MTHPKGPWIHKHVSYYADDLEQILSPDNELIASYVKPANAPLIAAAPKLLYWLTIAIERGISLGYECEEELALYEEITGTQYEYPSITIEEELDRR